MSAWTKEDVVEHVKEGFNDVVQTDPEGQYIGDAAYVDACVELANYFLGLRDAKEQEMRG